MKMRANWLLIPAVALGLGACEKKETPKAPDTKTPVAEAISKVTDAVKEVTGTKVSAEERAAKLGFVKHLPQDTEVVLSFYNGSKVAENVQNSKIWKLVQGQMGGGMGMGMPEPEIEMDAEDIEAPEAEQVETAPEEDVQDLQERAPDDVGDKTLVAGEPAGPAALFGTEVTLAMGKSTGEQLGNVLTFSRRQSYFQMRGIAKALAAAAKSGDFSTLEEVATENFSEELIKDLIKDPESGLALLEKAKMPPIYVAFRTSEADRASSSQQIAAMLASAGMFGDVVEPVTIENSGFKFEGYKLLGSKMSAAMAEDRESMEETLDAATVEQLLSIVAKKDIVAASGMVGDYVVLYIGGSTEDLKLSPDLAGSLVSSDTLAFSDAYISKDIAALSYGQKEATDTLIKAAGGLSDLTNGLSDGFAGAEGLGDTRDLEALFRIVAEREAALRKLAGNDASGMVAFFEDGLKIESFGGYDYGMVDWKATNKLAHLGASEDVLLFADVSVNSAYDEKSREYLEALLETGYALTMKVSELPFEDAEMVQFKEMSKLFDEKFRPDMIALWDALSNDFGGSLGNESALVVDLKGGAPAVPGIPQVVVDGAKMPRVSIIAPVTDRAKLSGSWDKINTTLTGTLGKVSEMTGQEIPMQKPLSSEKNGNITWFFPMPFFTDDFLPSVTVGDKWFAASTSKNHALDLIAKAEAGGETSEGFNFSMNFKALEKYADETYQLIDKNSEELMGGSISEDQKKLVKDSIAILSDMDKLTVHSRRESGVLRASVHFKTR